MKNIDSSSPISEIQILLENLGWLNNESISKIEIPGAGNMNIVLRVYTNQRTFILKQSRPFVQKYPDLAAPADRIDVEYQFYKLTETSIADHSAEVLAYSKEHHLMMLSDLGECEDMVAIYAERNVPDAELHKLVDIAQRIHRSPATHKYPANTSLRTLNHQHIFELPFMIDNGFGLDDVQPGLQDLSLEYKTDESLKSVIRKLGDQYLSKGTELIHGDYYPGSWMRTSDQLYVIDSEFSFIGFKEFDLGVMVAHLIITTSDAAYLDKVINYYSGNLDHRVVPKIAGTEIMRRLIGLAQLPLERNLEEKADLLKTAKTLILN
jgi:5-methylthioribose kinase